MVSILSYGHSYPWFDSQHSQKNFKVKMINVSQSHQWRWLEENGKWLENVDRTHLVLATGKPVLQKSFSLVWAVSVVLGSKAVVCLLYWIQPNQGDYRLQIGVLVSQR